jgi:hypothetical protein
MLLALALADRRRTLELGLESCDGNAYEISGQVFQLVD